MANHNRLTSMLLDSLLISTLLFSIHFSSCNGTSRGMESMNRAGLPSTEPRRTDPMANSCGERGSCQKTVVEQDLDRMHPELTDPSSKNAAVVGERAVDPRMSDNEVRNSESERNMDIDQLRGSDTLRDGQTMRNSDRIRDTERMGDTEHRTRDLARMRDPAHTGDSADTIRDMDRMMNSKNMRDSERMKGSDKLTDSEKMGALEARRDLEIARNADNMMDSAACESGNHHESEMMRDSDTIRASEGRRDLENARNADNKMDSAADESRNQDESEMMRDSDSSIRASEQKRDLAKNSDSLMDSAAAERHVDLNDEGKRGSEMIRDSDRNTASEERRDLEKTRDSNNMMNSAAAERQSRLGDMERQHASTMRISVTDDSKAESMEMQDESTLMKPNSCLGGNCNTMRLDSERSDSSQSKDSEATTDQSSTAVAASESCSKMNAADCDDAVDQGQLRGSKKMEVQSRGDSCKFNGADCRVTPDDGETSSQRFIEHMRSTNSAGISSCSDDHCRKSIANMEEEAISGMTNSERMHRTRRDREIGTFPKWTKLERMTAAHTKMMDSKNMANSKMTLSDSPRMRNAYAETTQISGVRDLGLIDAENRNGNIRGSDIAHSTSNHQGTSEINGQNSCTLGVNCGSTSGITHMSSRDAETMGHNDHESVMNHTGSMKSLENRDLTMNEENEKDSQMMQRKSDHMTISGETTSKSKMMRNPEETKSASLPIHDRD